MQISITSFYIQFSQLYSRIWSWWFNLNSIHRTIWRVSFHLRHKEEQYSLDMNIFVKYFHFLFNFQGLTSFQYREGSYKSSFFFKYFNLALPCTFLIIFFAYINMNAHRIPEILRIEENTNVSEPLRLVSTFFFNFHLIITFNIVFQLFLKQDRILKCFKSCNKLIKRLKLEPEVNYIISVLVLYVIYQTLIVIGMTLAFFQLMRATWESFILYIMMTWSSNITTYVVLMTVIFNHFIDILLHSGAKKKSIEQVRRTLFMANHLVKYFQLAYGDVLSIGVIQIVITFLILVLTPYV